MSAPTAPSSAQPPLSESVYATTSAKPVEPLPSKMLALAWEGKNSVKMVEAEIPKLVNSEDVVVKVTGTTLCGTDLHLLHGGIAELKKGTILGHEFTGIVESVGADVNKVQVGDRVVASFNIACGKCHMCQKRLTTSCTRIAMVGASSGIYAYSNLSSGFAGGQAEYARVPYANFNLLKIPNNVSDESALLLSNVLPASYHCVVDSGVKQGDFVGIWGAGPVGILSAKWAFLSGASRVILIDSAQSRLDYAKRKIPEVELLNFQEHKDVVARIKELTMATGMDAKPAGLDVALDCASHQHAKTMKHKVETVIGMESDTSEIVNECIRSVVPFGTVGITGIYTGLTNQFALGEVMEKGVRLVGNGMAPIHAHWETIMKEYLATGRIDPVDLILTHRISLDDLAKMYHKFEKKEQGLLKIFVQTKFSSLASPDAPQLYKIT